MPSTTLDPLAEAVAAAVATLEPDSTVERPFKAYARDPGYAGLDQVPCAVVGMPEIRRRGVDQPESQLGTRDWFIDYPVSFYCDIADPSFTAGQAIEIVEAFIKLIDTEGLQAADGTVLDAKVTEAIPTEHVDQHRPMLVYECTLSLFKLVEEGT